MKSTFATAGLAVLLFISCQTVRTTQTGNPDIVEKYWKLIEVNGQPVPPPAQNKREAHLILKTQDNRVNGNGGCNSFSSTYTLAAGNRISFSPVVATKMACLNDNREDEFFEALRQADSYAIKGDTLSLNRARMAPLARFVVVYLR